jgi:hypothetical protein
MQKKRKEKEREVESRPTLTADTRCARSRIAFAYPWPDRIDSANRMIPAVSQKRARCCIIFGMFDVTGIFIPNKTVQFNKILKADIQIIRSRSRIQFRPWNSNLFAAISASFAVEVRWHNPHGYEKKIFANSFSESIFSSRTISTMVLPVS